MFTGIIEQTGTLISIKETGGARRITVDAPGIAGRLHEGDSLAVSGVCLTALDVNETYFHADLAQETLDKTSLGTLASGASVNLELPTAAGSPLGGHIVQGHVDGTGAIASRSSAGGWDVVRISVPPELSRYVVEKGSVAIDGVSLTVSALSPPASPGSAPGAWLEVSLIPETLQRTTLGTKQPGDVVNLEVDMIAKYVERLLAGRQL